MSQTSKLMNHIPSSHQTSLKIDTGDVTLPNKLLFITQSDADSVLRQGTFSPERPRLNVTADNWCSYTAGRALRASLLTSLSLRRSGSRPCSGSTTSRRLSRCSRASGECGSTSAPRRRRLALASSCTSPSSTARSSNCTLPR